MLLCYELVAFYEETNTEVEIKISLHGAAHITFTSRPALDLNWNQTLLRNITPNAPQTFADNALQVLVVLHFFRGYFQAKILPSVPSRLFFTGSSFFSSCRLGSVQ